jgi:integrase
VLGNPCRGVERNHEEGRERFFSAQELAAISDALAEYSGSGGDCLRLIMFTGARPGEAMRATWSEFDVEPRYWVKPSAHTKQRRTHRVPLNPAALELVEAMRNERGPAQQWVFPGYVPGQHLATLEHVWRHVRRRTGLGADARPYDLRHSFASIGAGGGLSLPIIGKLLGHTQGRTTERYAHLADDSLREASAKIGAVITGAGKPGAPIVPIRSSVREDRRS